MLGLLLVRRYVALDRLTINNEIAGFKFATVGELRRASSLRHHCCLGEVVRAEVKVVNEAGAAENIYRLSQGLGDVNGGDSQSRRQLPESGNRGRLAGDEPWRARRSMR